MYLRIIGISILSKDKVLEIDSNFLTIKVVFKFKNCFKEKQHRLFSNSYKKELIITFAGSCLSFIGELTLKVKWD